jgi:hypothetical protein
VHSLTDDKAPRVSPFYWKERNSGKTLYEPRPEIVAM